MMNKSFGGIALLLVTAFTFVAAPSDAKEPNSRQAGNVSGNSVEIKAFFSSADYKSRHRTDAEFLRDVYEKVLGRAPDEKGLATWTEALKHSSDPHAREKAVEVFLKSPEFIGKSSSQPPKDTSRNPGNMLFNETGVFVNSASAFPPDLYAPKLKRGRVSWITLQIDNGGNVREDNVESIKKGWLDAWRKAGFKVGFWGAPRGVIKHTNDASIAASTPNVVADAMLAVKLTAEFHGDFYIADCEDSFQGYTQKDPAPALNRVYVDAFQKAATAAGIGNLPRAMSSMGRVALDMKPWIEGGWDAMPQAYWNSYAVYQPSKCVDFYVKDTGWPIGRVHPTIATFSGEGENRKVSLQEYAEDLKTRATTGFSFYLPESYLRLDDNAYDQLAVMSQR